MFFDATDVDPNGGEFTPLAAGWYVAQITEAEMVESQNPQSQAGEMLKLTFEVDPNEHPDVGARSVIVRLCINHANDTPREIGRRQLSGICHAIGNLELQDSDELLGARMRIKVKVTPARGDYGPGNDISSYASVDDDGDQVVDEAEAEEPAKATATATKKATAKKTTAKKATGKKAAPWSKKK